MDEPTGQNGEWFRTVVGRYEMPLVRFAARITGDVDQARDVVQDAFLRLHSQNGNRPDNVQAWLYTVCRRRALDVRRKETRMKTMDTTSLDHGGSAVCECPSPSQSAAIEQHETENHLLRLLADLPENQQEVVRLKFQDNLSYRDIAEVTGLSASNVGYLLHTAVKRLREQMVNSD
jgi:RNA polymerase sigma factor (sigma-70 family)